MVLQGHAAIWGEGRLVPAWWVLCTEAGAPSCTEAELALGYFHKVWVWGHAYAPGEPYCLQLCHLSAAVFQQICTALHSSQRISGCASMEKCAAFNGLGDARGERVILQHCKTMLVALTAAKQIGEWDREGPSARQWFLGSFHWKGAPLL